MKTKVSPLAAAILAAALITGCASSNHSDLPELRIPDSYGAKTVSNEAGDVLPLQATYPAKNIAQQGWWKAFGDDRLNRLIDQVLVVNNNLASAALNLRKARLQAGLATNDMWPKPSGNLSASSSRALDKHDTSQRNSGARIGLDWEIDLWGKLSAARDVAEWEAQATAEDLENTALALIAEVSTYYWNLAYLNQSIASGEAYLKQLEKVLELVQVQYDAGDVALLNVLEAQQNLNAQQSSQSQLKQQRVEVRNALTVLLDGKSWPYDDEPQHLEQAMSPSLAAGIPAEILGRRPDLRSAEMRLRKSLANIKATARSYYPALSLTANVGTGSTSLSDIVENPVGTLGAGLSLPFLNVHRMQLSKDIASTDYEIAVSNFRTTLYSALSEVNDALSAREQLALQVAASQRSLESAIEIEKMYAVRYEVGETTLRIWLDAQQTLRNAQLSYAQAKRNQLQNDVTLHLALGGSAQ